MFNSSQQLLQLFVGYIMLKIGNLGVNEDINFIFFTFWQIKPYFLLYIFRVSHVLLIGSPFNVDFHIWWLIWQMLLWGFLRNQHINFIKILSHVFLLLSLELLVLVFVSVSFLGIKWRGDWCHMCFYLVQYLL